jgi:hypothetical protein
MAMRLMSNFDPDKNTCGLIPDRADPKPGRDSCRTCKLQQDRSFCAIRTQRNLFQDMMLQYGANQEKCSQNTYPA